MIFEELLGAGRVRLAGGRCGLLYAGVEYPCFAGHDRFGEEALWTEHYAGPDFCRDPAWAFAAEEGVARDGLVEPYLEALTTDVYPDYALAEDRADVLDFWFALAHAAPRDRARAAAWAILGRDRVDRAAEGSPAGQLPGLEVVVEAAIALAEPLDVERFVAFVGGLDAGLADQLLATMYVGRGEHPTLAGALRAIENSVAKDGPAVVGRRMAGKAPLAQYLRAGLAKLRSESSGR
jgi:hypothetical protein